MSIRLVTIGDSLTQGFQSGAISKTQWSWPKMVAQVLGAPSFRVPDFSPGPGGPVVDLERLVRKLGAIAGQKLNWWELPAMAVSALQFMGEVEDYWERGPGTQPIATGPLHHNLAVWGFELGDCDTLSDAVCLRNTPEATDQTWLQNQLPEYAMYRTARRTLNPAQNYEYEDLTQLSAARMLAQVEGPIENLVVALGANNVLGTCASLTMRWSQSADIHKLAHQRHCTIWEPDHFARLLDRVFPELQRMQGEGLVQRVFVANVPHVTIAPIARGVSPRARALKRNERDAQGYYEYYTHFWVWDDDFSEEPEAYPRLNREDARLIDRTIDQYNADIRERAEKHGWHIIDSCQLLDELAFRRNAGKPSYQFPSELVTALQKNPATRFRVFPPGPTGEQRVLLDTRYLDVRPPPAAVTDFDTLQRNHYKGGIFSLDGVHPTTVGYGVFAHEALKVMQAAGVPGADPAALHWDDIVQNDSLVNDPPALLNSIENLLGFLSSRGPLPQLLQRIAGYGAQPKD